MCNILFMILHLESDYGHLNCKISIFFFINYGLCYMIVGWCFLLTAYNKYRPCSIHDWNIHYYLFYLDCTKCHFQVHYLQPNTD